MSQEIKQLLITEVILSGFCSDFVTRVVLSVRAKTTSMSLDVEAPEKTYWLPASQIEAVSKAIQFSVFGQLN